MAKRALNIKDVLSYKPNLLPFEGVWMDAFGCPEKTGSWLIWGNSSNGKTAFTMQLAKYLLQFGRVDYNSFEEGLSGAIQEAYRRTGITDARKPFYLLDREPIDELKNRLRKRRSADFVIIDSVQYTGMNYQEYKDLINEFRNKLFIFVSHADGSMPRGETAKSIRYDANVKVFVENFHTFPQSRYGGGEKYVVWQKGYEKYEEFK